MSTLRPTALLASLTAAAALAGTAAAAHATPRPPADGWTAQICTAVTTWNNAIVSRTHSLSVKDNSVRALHGALTGFLQGIVDDTDTMISTVDNAGIPSASHGTDVAHGLHQGLTILRGYFAQDLKRAQRLSTTNRRKFAAGATAIANALGQQTRLVTTTFDALGTKYRSAELDAAMNRVPACQSLR
jgi:hypothetical protein